MVFSHPLLINTKTKSHPVFIAAIMLHRGCNTETFAHFIRSIKQEIVRLSRQFKGNLHIQTSEKAGVSTPAGATEDSIKLCLLSDEERSLLTAAAQVNHGGLNMLCVLHLRSSLIRYLTKYRGALRMGEDEKMALVRRIFGKCGELDESSLLGSSNVEIFTDRRNELLDGLEDVEEWRNAPHVLHHLRTFFSDLQHHVFEPTRAFFGPRAGHTSNNAVESIHAAYKQYVDHRPMATLSEMIEFCNAQLQLRDSQELLSLHNTGDLQLLPEFHEFRCDNRFWEMQTPEWRQERIQAYMNFRLPRPEHVIPPTYRLPPSKVARKPGTFATPRGIRTRSRGGRSRTPRTPAATAAAARAATEAIRRRSRTPSPADSLDEFDVRPRSAEKLSLSLKRKKRGKGPKEGSSSRPGSRVRKGLDLDAPMRPFLKTGTKKKRREEADKGDEPSKGAGNICFMLGQCSITYNWTFNKQVQAMAMTGGAERATATTRRRNFGTRRATTIEGILQAFLCCLAAVLRRAAVSDASSLVRGKCDSRDSNHSRCQSHRRLQCQ
jgi:hypothetical protein